MNTELLIALITLAGSALGSLCGILASARLTTYRLKQLEIKVDKHNGIIERMFVQEEKMKVCEHRLADLEKGDVR
ncbi:MAG: hypothetical protein DBX47_07350 [Clostridiales bacterium]|nr:MAG: hypothetical protein DBX47_07350 [Clostridiales bacterium]